MQLPDYDFLPAPLWLITILHLVTLTLHFLAMNFMLGGVLIVLFGRFEDRWSNPTVKKFVVLFPSIMAATVTFGVAPLLFLQVVYPKQVYAASITSAWFWLGISGAAIWSYYFFYGSSFSKTEGPGRRPLYLLLAMLGLVYISVVYSSVFSMAENPELIANLYAANQSGLVLNTDVGLWIFRWAHMVLGALTVGGFFIGLLGKDDEASFAIGRKVFLYGMIAASLFGLFWLFTLGQAMVGLMRTAGIWYLTIGILLAFGSLHFFFKKQFLGAGLMLFVSVLGMVATRHELRLVQLGDKLANLPVRPQWDVFGLFLICFLAAIGVIAWMLKMFFEGEKAAA